MLGLQTQSPTVFDLGRAPYAQKHGLNSPENHSRSRYPQDANSSSFCRAFGIGSPPPGAPRSGSAPPPDPQWFEPPSGCGHAHAHSSLAAASPAPAGDPPPAATRTTGESAGLSSAHSNRSLRPETGHAA